MGICFLIKIQELNFFFADLQMWNSTTLLLFARRQHNNADDFTDEPDISCTSLTMRTVQPIPARCAL